MQASNYRISFCVVCMNRLHQLKQTLLQNIRDNEDYAAAEFVVLDYHSQDGMEDWARQHLQPYIQSGRVTYYRTTAPQTWDPSHSKNLVFKLAAGDILCNTWADYYTGREFAQYINRQFTNDDNIVLTPIDFHKTRKGYHPAGDVLGKVCVKKSDFLRIRGFDERMSKHGFEDYDFINRLEMKQVKRVLIEDFSFLRYLSHSNDERYSLPTDSLLGMYVNYLTPSSSGIILLFANHRYEKATLVDNSTRWSDESRFAYTPRKNLFEYSLQESAWETGAWRSFADDNLELVPASGHAAVFWKGRQGEHALLHDSTAGQIYYQMTDPETIRNMLGFNHFYSTRCIMEENLAAQRAEVNPASFGAGVVYKNFEPLELIIA